jgi:predicted nucleic acid-binding protein
VADRDPVAAEGGACDSAVADAGIDRGACRDVVLDTNVALDLLVFGDPATQRLARRLAAGRLRWIATGTMRAELARVLAYPVIAAQLARGGGAAAAVLQAFDARVRRVGAPAPAGLRCADPDDQMFIDLAVAHRALLLSRDRALLQLRARLRAFGVEVAAAFGA